MGEELLSITAEQLSKVVVQENGRHKTELARANGQDPI
jgi:hypothetical protein